jgi:hypothetical protein
VITPATFQPATSPTPAAAISVAAGPSREALASWDRATAAFRRAEHPVDFAALVLAADAAEEWQRVSGLRTPYGTGKGY